MTFREYQERLDRLLCLTCGRATRPQPNGQAYCPNCRRLDSFARRKREWTLVRAFAAGVTASAAAVVAGVTVGTAAKHFRRFRRALVDSTADTAAAYRRLKLKSASAIHRKSARGPVILGLIRMSRRIVFVWPAVSANDLAERLRTTRTPGVVLQASLGGGFASFRVVTPIDPSAVPAATAVRRVLRFWLSTRAAVLRHRAVRWAEIDGYLAEQACRQRMTTGGLIETLFDRVVRLKPGRQSGK